MVQMTVNHLLHWYNLVVAGHFVRATCTYFVDLLQHNIPISERACGPCFSEREELMTDKHYIWVPG